MTGRSNPGRYCRYGGNSFRVYKWACKRRGFAPIGIDPTDPDIIYASSNYYGYPAPSGLYLSEMAIDPLDPSTIYAYTGPIDFSGRWALLRSDDGGAAWTELEIGWPDEGATHYFDYLAVDLNGRAFVASHLGIFASTDRGISWSPLHAGLPPVEVNQLLVDPQGRGKVYAATSGGIFVLELSEIAVAEAATGCAIPPAEPSLAQNFPNPFNPTTTIAYVLPTAGTVRLQIYDIGGQLVRRLLAERRPSGLHQVVWDGRDDAGATVATGAYLCELRTGTFRSAIKMILIRYFCANVSRASSAASIKSGCTKEGFWLIIHSRVSLLPASPRA